MKRHILLVPKLPFGNEILVLVAIGFVVLIISTGQIYTGISGQSYSDSLSVSDSIDLVQGKILYKKNCGKCHTLYKPKEYTLREWKKNLVEMREKAAITEDDYKLILSYLSKNCGKN